MNNGSTLQEDLSPQFLRKLKKEGIAAIDTELTGLNPNRDRICIVQVSDSAEHGVILRAEDWSLARFLKELLFDKEITKVFHYALVDCSFILKHIGIEVQKAYCTKIASKIARTYVNDHTLYTLVQEFFDIRLDKSKGKSDWLSESITDEQLKYAFNDVRYLISIKTRLDDLLARKGMLPTGISYSDFNAQCQAFIPTLVHLWINGWDAGFNS